MARHGKPLKGKKSTGDGDGDESPAGIVKQGVPSKTGLRAVPAVCQLLWSEKKMKLPLFLTQNLHLCL